MIVTAALLEKGDVIKMYGKNQVVAFIDKTHVHYVPKRYITKKLHWATYTNTIGLRSKQRIELIERPEPPKEKPKRAKGEYSNTTPFGIKIT